jgi:hypothetical protein
MQVIYNCIPETNHVSTEYSVAATLLKFMAHIMLFPMLNLLDFYITTFRSTRWFKYDRDKL